MSNKKTNNKVITGDQASALSPTFVRAADFKAIYANFVQFGYTAFDISFVLCDTAGATEDEFVVEQKSRVVMSPSEAKLVHVFLGNTLREFEKRHGAIHVPPQAIPEGVVLEDSAEKS